MVAAEVEADIQDPPGGRMKRMWAIWICPEHDYQCIGCRLDEYPPACSLCVVGEGPPMERVVVEEVK